MPRTAGEMPFLDHLEELRTRILRSLLAITVCFGVGLWLVDRFKLINELKRPIAPFLPNGQLTVLSPTEPLMIVFKLGFILGLVLASPIILWQLWAFLSPALYEREKKTLVPALFVGLGLFLGGSGLAFVFVVPQALRVLLSFQRGSFATMITFDAYFSFVMQLVLALGLSFELPLLMIILAALGIIATPMLNRIRPYAIVASFALGAVLSPGTDVLSMFMLTIPLLLLYEIGVAGVWVVQRRRLKAARAGAAGAVVLLLCCLATPAGAQRPVPRPVSRATPSRPGQPPLPSDTGRARAARRLDSASARRLGLPSAPRLQFEGADSIVVQLLDLEGYAVTRYRADTANVQALDHTVDLRGNAMTDRSGSILEAASIRYQEGKCTVEAKGEPHLFQGGQVLIGSEARFDTCNDRGVVREALTQFQEGGNWFIRGHLAVDSSRSRLYGGDAELTSCDLPIPHYHFSAKEIKWVSKSVMVARPAILYIRDVPIAWIPFIFQDTKQGRHSGILIPQFGFNDIVRPTRNYNRQVSNIGYYWAPNDYFDAQLQLDWFSNRYLQYGITTQYRILNRFVSGGINYEVQSENGGGTAKSISWRHAQSLNVSTTLNFDVSYSTNSSIIARNTIDPRVSTQQIRSSGTFSKRYPWGNFTVGGNRSQNINNGSGTMTLPSISLTPKSLDFGPNVTWSPNASFNNVTTFKSPLGSLLVPRTAGAIDTIPLTGSTRVSSFQMQTPLRLWSFNWQNSVAVVDNQDKGRHADTFKVPNPDTPDPNDSVSVTQFRNGGFSTTLDWDTSVNLPILFRSTWKFTPSVGITNAAAGQHFAVRNTLTGGQFVHQGKRLQFGVSIAPTFFAFFPGFAGAARFRHSVSPSLTYSYSPAASVPEEFARAIVAPGQPLRRTSPATQTVSLTLNQNLEAKGHQTPGDSTGISARKLRVLNISTTPISYDFERAKVAGQTGWTMQTLGNTLTSDLLPGFNFSFNHDLWDGPVGFKTSKFSPFLSSLNTSFSITGNTLRSIGALFGLASRPADGSLPQAGQVGQPIGGVPLPGQVRRSMILAPSTSLGRGGRPFSARITYSLARIRPLASSAASGLARANLSSIAFTSEFSPTRFWGVTWQTQYNATKGVFESQSIQLTRDLHEWRAAFSFEKAPNGNFSFFFSVFLSDFTDLKFDYNQTTIRPQ